MEHEILVIDSKDYPEQKANDLTVVFDEEFSGVKGVKITHLGIPCTFYNISEELKNNKFKLYDKTKWKNLIIPDGFYDLRSFLRAFYIKAEEITGSRKRVVLVQLDDTTGKTRITFDEGYRLRLYEHNIFGFDVVDSLQGKTAEIPKSGEKDVVSDKPIRFKPFEYFCVHSNITNSVLFNGKKSDLLLKTFVKKCDFGDRIRYNVDSGAGIQCDDKFNKINLWITDEYNKLINFNDGTIQYELVLMF